MGRSKQQRRTSFLPPAWIIATLILIAFSIYVDQLDGQSLWRDEGLSVVRARQSLTMLFANRNIVDGVESPDLHPPFYFLILHGWRVLAGESEFALRLPSALAMVMALAMFYAAGKRIWGQETGLWAAGLAVLSPFFSWYAQEARMYTLVVLESAFLIYCTWPLLRKGPGWKDTLAFGLAAVLLASTHYVGLFLVLAAVLMILTIQLRGLIRWRRLLIPAALVGASLVFLYPHIRELWQSPDFLAFAPRPLWHIIQEVVNTFTLGSTIPMAEPGWRLVPFAALGVAGALTVTHGSQRERWRVLLAGVGSLLVPLLLFFAASWLKANYSNPRHLTILSAPWYLLMGHGLTTLRRYWRPLAIVAGAGVLIAGGTALYRTRTEPPMVRDDVRRLAAYVEARMAPGDLLLWHDAIMMVTYEYYALDLPHEAAPRYGQSDETQVSQRLPELAADHERIWFVSSPAPAYFDKTLVPEWLRERMVLIDSAVFPASWASLQLRLYQRPQTAGSLEGPVTAVDLGANGTHIRGVVQSDDAVAGEGVWIPVVWSAEENNEAEASVCLRLLDSAAVAWAEGCTVLDTPDDQQSLPTGMVQQLWLDLPIGLAPTTYRMELILGNQIQVVGPFAVNRSPEPPAGQRLANFDGGLQLIGVEWAADRFRAGLWALGELVWHTTSPIDRELSVTVRIVDWLGRTVSESSSPLGPADYPGSEWKRLDTVRSAIRVELPFEMDGRYQAKLQVTDNHGTPLAKQGWLSGSTVDLGTIRVDAWPLNQQLPDELTAYPEEVFLGETIQLAGYDMVREDDLLTVKLYWRSEDEVAADYGVFVHVGEPGQVPVAQASGGPANWMRPTTTWRAGEIIEDSRTVELPADIDERSLSVLVGMYRLDDPNARLSLTAGGESVPDNAWNLGALSEVPAE